VATKVELLIEMNRVEEAVAFGEPALAYHRERGSHHFARALDRALALADAKLGRFDAARARIEGVIREQLEIGVGGLQLGLSYETGARVAIVARDSEQFERYAALTAACYKPGRSSVLGALYERLQEDARAAGLIESRGSTLGSVGGGAVSNDSASISQHVESVMGNCAHASDRARAALLLLCARAGSRGGILFLLSFEGLTVKAATLDHASVELAREFAQSFLDAEIDRLRARYDRTVTVNACDALTAAAVPNTWRAPDGTDCTAVLISGALDDQRTIAGVAMLTGSNLSIATLSDTTAALTKCLVKADIVPGALIAL
jgi:hypothetical protein